MEGSEGKKVGTMKKWVLTRVEWVFRSERTVGLRVVVRGGGGERRSRRSVSAGPRGLED